MLENHCEKSGNYVGKLNNFQNIYLSKIKEAEMAKNRIFELKKHYQKNRKEETKTKHGNEVNLKINFRY